MYINKFIFLLAGLLILQSCAEVFESPTQAVNTGDWLIPGSQVYDGGPGKDGIPALRNPEFISASQARYLSSNSRVLIYKRQGEVKAYPHPILDWHEIINDNVNGANITISYCPLTGSGIGYDSTVRNNNNYESTTFGVSGMLYNSNLILYDRLTDSYWSQMRMQCVGGNLKGQFPLFVHLVETTFGTLKKLYPNALVVSTNTGIYSADQYQRYPYGDYRTNHNKLLFPVSPSDGRLPRKERVLGVIGDQSSRAYQFKHFTPDIQVINDEIDGLPIVVAGSLNLDFAIAFQRADSLITMKKTNEPLPAVMEDSNGNVFNIFGEVIAGPDQGARLSRIKSYIAFWFSFGAFYPGIEIYGE